MRRPVPETANYGSYGEHITDPDRRPGKRLKHFLRTYHTYTHEPASNTANNIKMLRP
jgi:hypothetical protein